MAPKSLFIPSVFTFLNFFWGFFAIVKTIEGNLHAAAWFIILAILCDGMDGKLARWTNCETPFGFELDSMGDLVSSGLAPALLAFVGGLHQVGFLGMLICFLYLFGGGYRLARFNVLQAGDRSKGYAGLPIPVAGLAVASLWLFDSPFGHTVASKWWIALMIFLGVLMVSTVHYDWPRLMFRGSWKNVVQSVGILLAVGMMAVFPQWSLFPLFLLYILLGVGNWAVGLIKGDVALTDFFLLVRKQ